MPDDRCSALTPERLFQAAASNRATGRCRAASELRNEVERERLRRVVNRLMPHEFPHRTFLAVVPRSASADARFGEAVAGGKHCPRVSVIASIAAIESEPASAAAECSTRLPYFILRAVGE